jgi:hypothetical protein
MADSTVTFTPPLPDPLPGDISKHFLIEDLVRIYALSSLSPEEQQAAINNDPLLIINTVGLSMNGLEIVNDIFLEHGHPSLDTFSVNIPVARINEIRAQYGARPYGDSPIEQSVLSIYEMGRDVIEELTPGSFQIRTAEEGADVSHATESFAVLLETGVITEIRIGADLDAIQPPGYSNNIRLIRHQEGR